MSHIDPTLLGLLILSCVALLVLEFLGVKTTLSLEKSMKGDVKRESRFLAQYGQSVCTPIGSVLVWALDKHDGLKKAIVLSGIVLGVSVVCMLLKRCFGRMRPGKPNAGAFTGPSWKHSNARESFPSSHSACAVAFSVVLAHYYPGGLIVFWALAIVCAGLRYVLDAHYPSDVMGGIALGYVLAKVALYGVG